MADGTEKLSAALQTALDGRTLKKLVLSKPSDRDSIRTAGVLLKIGGETVLQLETFRRDGKALHENVPLGRACARVTELLEAHGQLDLVTTGGALTVMRSKKGALHFSGRIGEGEASAVREHDREKARFLTGAEPFLREIGVSDANGRVNDRARPKFRQICRFLELLDDVYGELPAEGVLRVFDLCCGKSYLTFAVEHYLTKVKGRDCVIAGVDRKADVMETCAAAAARLGLDDMTFTAADVTTVPLESPDLVVSLHACDVATDLVLAAAMKAGAKVILSTPCCHHEMLHQTEKQPASAPLGFISHSILRQKLCDAATDSLRALYLEAEGYEVEALELVDPEETPKNVLLRAVKRGTDEKRRAACLARYDAACDLLGADPMLRRLMAP